MNTTELREVVEEEASIMEPDGRAEVRARSALYRVLDKLERQHYVWTSAEKAAVLFAMEDVGELYSFAGTSAGFDADTPEEARGFRSRGDKALEQARAVGLVREVSGGVR